tara:strand:- start:756 stop:935 length:180 start_codon:yes stop_codon:yes gene_type:complete
MSNDFLEINKGLKSVFFENANSSFLILNGDMDFVDANQVSLNIIGVNKENLDSKMFISH